LNHPALITTWWVPPLFGLAGFIIGWMYILLDSILTTEGGGDDVDDVTVTVVVVDEEDRQRRSPSVPFVLLGIAIFTFQYWLSGVLFASSISGGGDGLLVTYDRGTILILMTLYAGWGFTTLDRTLAGFITSLATAIGGPLIEVGLISTVLPAIGGGGEGGGYHYMDGGETGFFPLWIVPVYFLGGPANGNLARAFWNAFDSVGGVVGGSSSSIAAGATKDVTTTTTTTANEEEEEDVLPCEECNDSRAVPCGNCEGQGSYVTYNQSVRCNCCRGSGNVMCRSCFNRYGEDPADIEGIRDFMARRPD